MKSNFNDYVQAARDAISTGSETVSPFFENAQTRPRLSQGQKVQAFQMLMQTFNNDQQLLSRFMDAQYGEGSGDRYLKEIAKLQGG